MRIDEFITALRKNNNVSITAENGELKIKAKKEDLTPEVISEIKEKKVEILQFFKSLEKGKSISKANDKANYVLTSAQSRLFFLNAFDKDSLAYNMPLVVKLVGKLDKAKLGQAFALLIERHPGFRTFFKLVDDKPVQCIVDKCTIEIEEVISNSEDVNAIINEFVRSFDIGNCPLLRVGLIERESEEHLLMMDVHHIITDGVSQSILTHDLLAFYNGMTLPQLKIQYIDFAEWQQSEEQQEQISKEKEYWLNCFSEEVPKLQLPEDFKRPSMISHEGDVLNFELSTTETEALKLIARKEGATLFMLTLSVFNIFLSKIGNQEDIVVGTPVSGRQHADIDSVIGMFVNTLPLRNFPKGDLSFTSFLKSVKGSLLNAFNNQSFQFEDLIEGLDLARDTAHNPLFDVLFVYNNFEPSTIELNGLKLEPFQSEHKVSKFDVTLDAVEHNDKLAFTFEYSMRLFKKETIEQFAVAFKEVIAAIISNSNIEIKDIDVLGTEERNRLQFDFNSTSVEYSKNETVLDLFKIQVEQQPSSTAIKIKNASLTYLELNEKSNQLANFILSEGVQSEELIAICLDRSLEMVIGILGIMKAGCAYVPIDPEYPKERIDFILEDTASKVLLCQTTLESEYILSSEVKSITLDSFDFSGYASTSPEVDITVDHLAYVIYTSGTTGRPKGVMNQHSGIYNRLLWMRDYLDLQSEDVILQKTTFCFDVSVWELILPLITGVKMVLAEPDGHKDSSYLQKLIAKEKVSIMHFVPSMLSVFLLDANNDQCKSLKHVVCSGEELKPTTVHEFKEKLSGTRLHNLYGPTEAAIDVTAIDLTEFSTEETLIPIGKPVANTQLYIVDRHIKLQPEGVAGELLIGGIQVARGYLNREELTTEKFIANPFNESKESKLYRTGDLARWMSDGNIEYLGRIDNQVKIRGYRIELGEIENSLSNYQDIDQAVVLVKEQGDNKLLVAYYVAEQEVETEKLKGHLLSSLPDYMVPAHYVHLTSMPFTSSGKLDRKGLPEFQMSTQSEYVAPTSKEECLLANVWTEVLGIEKISITDNYFSVGGDSIKSIQISSRMRGHGYEVSVKDIFTNQTIRALAPTIKTLSNPTDQSAVTGPVALSPIQHWFFEGPMDAKHHFNHAVMLEFKNRISGQQVTEMFEAIVEHHDALRMVFKKSEDEWTQENKDTGSSISISEHDLKGVEDSRAEMFKLTDELQSSLCLESGPLVKLGLYHLDDRSQLLVIIHHLIVDGVSWRFLFEDIENIYLQQEANKPVELPLKTDSFKDWSLALKEYKTSKQYQIGSAYWEAFQEENFEVIPQDLPNGKNQFKHIQQDSIKLDKAQTVRLLTDTHTPFNTKINDVLLVALLIGVKKQFDLDSVLVDLEGHGREDIGQNINVGRTIGWFTIIYPVLLKKSSNEISEILREVKENLRNIPNSGIDFLLGEFDDLSAESKHQSPQISFNYLGDFDSVLTDNVYSLSNYPKGHEISQDSHRVYELDVWGIILEGELEISIAYSSEQYNASTISGLITSYKESLLEIIDYCESYNGVQLSPSDLSYKALSISNLDSIQNRFELKDIYALSPMQEGMLFHSLFDPASSDNFLQLTYHIEGNLDLKAVEQSMNDLMERYDVLRTIFLNGYEQPLQMVLAERKIDFIYQDIQEECKQSSLNEVMENYKVADRSNTFNLENDVLMRLSVFKSGADSHEFIWSCHHILMDGWCMGIIIGEFSQLYAGHLKGSSVELPKTAPYSNYINWLNERDSDVSEAYWKDYLSGYKKVSTFPRSVEEIHELPFKQAFHELVFDEDQTAKVDTVIREERVTLNNLIHTAWGILLQQYNSGSDVAFGSVVSGRPTEIEGVESMIGLFINTVPVRIQIGEGTTLSDLLSQVQNSALESEEHHYHPLSEIQTVSELGRDLFDHIMVVENFPIAEQIDGGNDDQQFKANANGIFEKNQFNLTLFIYPEDELKIKFVYNSSYYSKEFIEQISGYLNAIISSVVADSSMELASLKLISDEERTAVFDEIDAYDPSTVSDAPMIPASYHQERMWFIDKFESGYLYDEGPVYHNIPLILEMKGAVDVSILEQSITNVIDKHEILRTSIINIDERPYQQVNSIGNFELKRIDSNAAQGYIESEVNTPFDLKTALVRASLLEHNSNDYSLLVVFHHSIVDRYSIVQLSKEITQHYYELKSGKSEKFVSTGVQYSAFSQWEKGSLIKLEFEALNYWKRHLEKVKALEFPTDSPRAAIHIYESSNVGFKIPSAITSKLVQYASEQGVELKMVLMAAFKVLLHKYAGHSEIVIGTSVHNRTEKLVDTIGPMANLVVVKSDVLPELSFTEYVNQLDGTYRLSEDHQSIPFDKLVKELAPKKDMSRTALFDVLFQFDSEELKLEEKEGLAIEFVEPNVGYGKYDLNLLLKPKSDTIEGELVFNKLYFEQSTIETFTNEYSEILMKMVENASQAISSFPVLSKEDASELLERFDFEDVDYPDTLSIIDVFEAQVKQTPNNCAIQFESERISYAELDKLSTQLALNLRSKGVERETIVALLIDKTMDAIVGMLGILKAGGAYLPIDVDYPVDRVKYILNDSNAKVVLTTKDTDLSSIEQGVDIVFIEDAELVTEGIESFKAYNEPTDLCYVIYTSGTTGNPKGVMLEHKNVVRLLFNDALQFRFDSNDVWSMFFNHCFDFSVWEIYGALLYGAKLLIVPKSVVKDTSKLLDLLYTEKVTVLNQTPSAFYSLIEFDKKSENKLNLRYIVFGGEALNPAKLDTWYAKYPETDLINMYGITEVTVHTSFKLIEQKEIDEKISNIGLAIPTTSLYVMDEFQQLSPRGAIGEIYVGGDGVARGYLGKPELTKDRFITSPFKENGRLYASGDLARITSEKELEYIGRKDHQVQLRGFRIEMGEIENQLVNHALIDQAAVIVKGKDEDKMLVAYYISNEPQETMELRSYLMDHLPDYMIPTFYVHIKELPLTSNGKIDKKALPDYEVNTNVNFKAANSESQKKLAKIWSAILHLDEDKISIDDDFFHLGGHSIKAVHLINGIQDEFSIKIQLSDVFNNTSVYKQSELINSLKVEELEEIPRLDEQADYIASSAQERLYYEYLQNPTSLAYNITRVYSIEGELDLTKAFEAFQEMVIRHEGLRTSFHLNNDGIVQRINADVKVEIEELKLEGQKLTASDLRNFVRPFDLASDSLIRFGIANDSENGMILLMDVHHIVCDGISLNILMNDFKGLYQEAQLPSIPLRYVDYASWQNGTGNTIENQEAYWKEQLSGELEELELPRLTDKESIVISDAKMQELRIEGGDYEQVKNLSAAAGTSDFMFFLSLYYVLLSKITGATDIIIGSDVAGRSHVDSKGIVGTFINILPLRADLDAETEFLELLTSVKKVVLDAYSNQDFQYDQMLSTLEGDAQNSSQSIVDVHFAFSNFYDSNLEIEGLNFKAVDVQVANTTQYEFKLEVFEAEGVFAIQFIYSPELYDDETVEALMGYFECIRKSVIENSKILIEDIQIVEMAQAD